MPYIPNTLLCVRNTVVVTFVSNRVETKKVLKSPLINCIGHLIPN